MGRPRDLHVREHISVVDGLQLGDGLVDVGLPGRGYVRVLVLVERTDLFGDAVEVALFPFAFLRASRPTFLMNGSVGLMRPWLMASSMAGAGNLNVCVGRLWQSMQSMVRIGRFATSSGFRLACFSRSSSTYSLTVPSGAATRTTAIFCRS